MTWRRNRLDGVAQEVRETIDPQSLGDLEVDHYSIPALEATGHPDVVPANEIMSGKQRLRGGEVLVSRLNPRKARVLTVPTLGTRPALSSGEFIVLRPFGVDPRFLTYLLLAESTRQFLDARVQSVTRSHQRVRPEHLTKMSVDLPDRSEQRTIVDFLDAETARIDAVIAKKRRLLQLLDERLTSERERLIGYQPSARWAALGRFVSSITQGVSPQASNSPAEGAEWGLLKLSAVKRGRFLPGENKALPADFTFDHRLIPSPGDLLVTRSNTPSYVGDACAVTTDAGRVVLCDLIYRVRLRDGLLPEFAAQVLLTQKSRAHLSSNARGTSQSMVKLRGEDIKACPVPILSVTEQRRVLSEFETVGTLSAAVRARLVAQIDLMVEHREALITAAVTGELAVPGVAV